MLLRKALLLMKSFVKNKFLWLNNNNQCLRATLLRWTWPPWRSLRSNLEMNKRGITSWGSTKWRRRLRCAEIGSLLESANLWINAHSLMESMNLSKRSIFLLTIKLKYARNFILLHFVPMVIGASFCIRNSIYSINSSVTVWSWMKMQDFPMRDQTNLKKLKNFNPTLTFSRLRDSDSLNK
jgi:hypothetical protein